MIQHSVSILYKIKFISLTLLSSFFITSFVYAFDPNDVVPDPVFRECININIDPQLIDRTRDQLISKKDMETLPAYQLACYNKTIASTEGLQYAVNLRRLILNNSGLKEINLKGLKKLARLELQHNQLEHIDLSDQTELLHLFLNDNKLKELDLSKHNSLKTLVLGGNKSLAKLKLPEEYKVRMLDLKDLELETLELPKKSSIYIYLQKNKLKEINLSNQTTVKRLNLSNNQLAEVNLSGLKDLGVFYAAHNQLTDIDLSDQSQLTELDLSHNQLKEVSLPSSSKLRVVYLSGNQLKDIDLSGFDNLTQIQLAENKIISTTPEIQKFYRKKNPSSTNTLNLTNQEDELEIDGNYDLNEPYRLTELFMDSRLSEGVLDVNGAKLEPIECNGCTYSDNKFTLNKNKGFIRYQGINRLFTSKIHFIKPVKVKFDCNEGTKDCPDPDTVIVPYEEKVNKPTPNPFKDDEHEFKGWCEDTAPCNDEYFNFDTEAIKDLPLVADWRKKPKAQLTVKLKGNGKGEIRCTNNSTIDFTITNSHSEKRIEVTNGDTFTCKAKPANGYFFDRWEYQGKDVCNSVGNSSGDIKCDITYKADPISNDPSKVTLKNTARLAGAAFHNVTFTIDIDTEAELDIDDDPKIERVLDGIFNGIAAPSKIPFPPAIWFVLIALLSLPALLRVGRQD